MRQRQNSFWSHLNFRASRFLEEEEGRKEEEEEEEEGEGGQDQNQVWNPLCLDFLIRIPMLDGDLFLL